MRVLLLHWNPLHVVYLPAVLKCFDNQNYKRSRDVSNLTGAAAYIESFVDFFSGHSNTSLTKVSISNEQDIIHTRCRHDSTPISDCTDFTISQLSVPTLPPAFQVTFQVSRGSGL